jgi:4-amino-4-deoxy-L-arabinose transferase-like glycosyltransferase
MTNEQGSLIANPRTGPRRSARLVSWRPEARPWWAWAGAGAVAILALVLFTWGLSRNGMANGYYAAAVKSGSISWKAWFFGALDPGSFITVDKLPASLWLEGLSARIFGFSSWSMLLPEALAGVASVLILYRLVRRWQGEVAGLLAAAALALTPVAVVMFRFNNPDALLTLLLLGAAWALWSALEKGSTWKLVACGALVGFAFLTKMLEALVILPAFALVYVVCGPRRLGRRLLQLLAAAGALLVAGGWYVAVVALWPAATRPYIGGSGDNSVLGLVFSRTAGYTSGSVGGPNFSGTPGWSRIFNSQLGGQVAWLVIVALAGLLAGLWLTRRGRRTDLGRAGYLLWGMWAALFLGAFSFASGVLHPYYMVVLAPALAALAGGGSVAMWRLGKRHLSLAWLLPAAVLATAFLSYLLLRRTASFAPGLAAATVIMGAVAAVMLALVLAHVLKGRTIAVAAGAIALLCVLAGPAAYSVATVSRSVTGALAAAGPATAAGFLGGGPGGGPGVVAGGPGSQPSDTTETALERYLVAGKGSAEYIVAVEGAESAEPLILATGEPVMAMGGFNGADSAPTLADFQQLVVAKKVRYVLLGMGQGFGGPPGPGFGPPPGQSAAGQAALAANSGGGGGFPGGPGGFGGSISSISQWVQSNATVVDPSEYGGASGSGTLYRLW